ncbi:MAG: aminoacyl-tRNA hydrolase [Bacillota bacterium]
MKLVIGLGNPGKKYQKTRHNIGFMCVDAYASSIGEAFSISKRFYGEVLKTKELVLLKPHTYMNLSGQSVKAAMDYYNIDTDDILVIHDDLDLPTAKLRLRFQGSAGGHNGVKSIITHIQTEQFKRVKFGIDQSAKMNSKVYVLKPFKKSEIKDVKASINQTISIIEAFVKDIPFNNIMNTYN